MCASGKRPGKYAKTVQIATIQDDQQVGFRGRIVGRKYLQPFDAGQKVVEPGWRGFVQGAHGDSGGQHLCRVEQRQFAPHTVSIQRGLGGDHDRASGSDRLQDPGRGGAGFHEISLRTTNPGFPGSCQEIPVEAGSCRNPHASHRPHAFFDCDPDAPKNVRSIQDVRVSARRGQPGRGRARNLRGAFRRGHGNRSGPAFRTPRPEGGGFYFPATPRRAGGTREVGLTGRSGAGCPRGARERGRCAFRRSTPRRAGGTREVGLPSRSGAGCPRGARD